MRKYLLFVSISLLTAFNLINAQGTSQFPCISTIQVLKNGSGNSCAPTPCPNKVASGVISVTFANALPTGTNPPTINVIREQPNGPALDFCFAVKANVAPTNSRRTYEYCFYGARSNSNLFNGSASLYYVNITYANAGGSQNCTVTVPDNTPPLPVKLNAFNARRNKDKVAITWETAMETNNSGLDIQRKVGNSEWKTIAFMFSKATGGNSNSVLTYEYTDINTNKGVSQYRLRQVDVDTRATLSEVRSVRGEEQASKLLIYPNPSLDGKLNLVFEERNINRNISVSDISGRMVKQYRNITSSSLQIDNLENGIYTLHITDVNTAVTTVEKVIVKKR